MHDLVVLGLWLVQGVRVGHYGWSGQPPVQCVLSEPAGVATLQALVHSAGYTPQYYSTWSVCHRVQDRWLYFLMLCQTVSLVYCYFIGIRDNNTYTQIVGNEHIVPTGAGDEYSAS